MTNEIAGVTCIDNQLVVILSDGSQWRFGKNDSGEMDDVGFWTEIAPVFGTPRYQELKSRFPEKEHDERYRVLRIE